MSLSPRPSRSGVRLLLVGLWAGNLAVVGAVLKPGERVQLGGHTVELKTLDARPQVDSDYRRRFRFDSSENPKLRELREREGLDAVAGGATAEFDRQVRLMDWVHRRFPRFGQPSTNAQGALEIVRAIDSGHTFFCSQYAQLMVSAAASLGWVDRPLALRRHQGVNRVGGSTEHAVTEIWSNQHDKWVMLDPTSNLYVERDGVPLNAIEIRQEWFYRAGTNLVFVQGTERKRHRKADLPFLVRKLPGFGDLTLEPDELDKYGFTAFIPNTDLMDSGFDYAGMFLVKDALCDGTRWHERNVPMDPLRDPYFPLGETSLELSPEGGAIRVTLATWTPNLRGFEFRTDPGTWQTAGTQVLWSLHDGENRLEARTLNRLGVAGPVSVAVVDRHP